MGNDSCSSARKGNASGGRLTGGAGLHTKPTTDEVLVMDIPIDPTVSAEG